MEIITPNGILKTENAIRGINGVLFEILPKDNPSKYRLILSCYIKTDILSYNIETEFITLELDGKLTLLPGFLSDGATWYPDIDSIIRAFFFHDALFTLVQLGFLNISYTYLANKAFRVICKKDGMCKINRFLTRVGLAFGSRRHIKKLMFKQRSKYNAS